VQSALVQAFGREDEESPFRAPSQAIATLVGAEPRADHLQPRHRLLFGLGGAVIFGYGGYLVYRGALTVGDLIVFTGYLGMIWGPLCQLTGFSYNVQGGVAGADQVFAVLDEQPAVADRADAQPLPRQPRTLELSNIGFAYNQGAGWRRG
jgi:ABC-type multidrug transport system fused ATPase/permease subunit